MTPQFSSILIKFRLSNYVKYDIVECIEVYIMYYLNKIKNHLVNWANYLVEHLVRIFFIICLFILICFLFINYSIKVNTIEQNVIIDQRILFFGITLDNWSTFLAIVGVVGTAIWALYEFDKMISRNQQEKGAEIANIFSEHLLRECHVLGNVIKQTKLCSSLRLSQLKYTAFKNFDRNELSRLYPNSNSIFTDITNFVISDEAQQIYLRILESQITLSSYEKLKDKIYSSEDATKLFELDNKDFPFKFSELIYTVLNQLEAVCMNIASQAAGSKYVYQSLHQIFLQTIKLLAPVISCSNKKNSDKYYTSIIHVYNNWVSIREFEQKKEHKKIDRINKIMNPKIKTV